MIQNVSTCRQGAASHCLLGKVRSSTSNSFPVVLVVTVMASKLHGCPSQDHLSHVSLRIRRCCSKMQLSRLWMARVTRSRNDSLEAEDAWGWGWHTSKFFWHHKRAGGGWCKSQHIETILVVKSMFGKSAFWAAVFWKQGCRGCARLAWWAWQAQHHGQTWRIKKWWASGCGWLKQQPMKMSWGAFIDSERAGVAVLLKCEVAGSHYTFQMPSPILKKEGVQPTKPFLLFWRSDGRHLDSVQHEAVFRVGFSSTSEKMLTAVRWVQCS